MIAHLFNLGAIAFYAFSVFRLVRYRGFSLACLVPAGLALYLPIRAEAINLGLATYESGSNPRVQWVADLYAEDGAFINFLVALCFSVTVIAAMSSSGVSKRQTSQSAGANWARAVPALFVVGLPGLMQQLVSSLAIFASGQFETESGVLSQAAFLSYFAMCVSVYLNALTYSSGSRRRLLMLGIPLLVAVAGGSKDTLTTIGIAAGSGYVARWSLSGERFPRRQFTRLASVGALVVLVAFPAIQTYRIGVEVRGLDLGQSLREMGSTYSKYNVTTGRELNSDDVNNLSGSLLYLSTRFHGYDSMVLTLATDRDATYLPLSSVAAIPTTVVLPVGALSTAPDPRRFATEIWGSSSDGSVHVAMGATTQALKAYGVLGAIAMAAVLGAVTAAAHRSFHSGSIARSLVGLVLLLAALSFERDVLFTAATTLRRLALVMLITWMVSRLQRRQADDLAGSRSRS